MVADLTQPAAAQVRKFREQYQSAHDLGITAAQQECAEMARVKIRAWQQWETGDRGANLASWELVLIKTGKTTG